jgi:hypothetical protein
MDRFVIMVDAGYLLHKGVEIVSKRASTERRDLELTDPFALIRLVIDQSRTALALGMHTREYYASIGMTASWPGDSHLSSARFVSCRTSIFAPA